jgi:hypothetical protein
MMDFLVAVVAEAGPRTAAIWLASSVALNVLLLALLLRERYLDITQEQGSEL